MSASAGGRFLRRATRGNIKYSVIKQCEHRAQQNLNYEINAALP